MTLRLFLASCVAGVGLTACAVPAPARAGTATCATIEAVLDNARGGETVTLTGNCGVIRLPQRNNRSPVTIDASAARLSALIIRSTSGWRWKGGTFATPNSLYRSILIDGASRIQILAPRIESTLVGIAIMRGSDDIVIRKAVIHGIGADGVNIDGSTNVTLEDSEISDFVTVNDFHADGVQVWGASRNITIAGNTIRGKAQGITTFGPGVTAGMRVTDNVINVYSPWAISLQEEADAVVMRNKAIPLDPKDPSAPKWSWHPRIWTHPGAVRKDNVMNGKPVKSHNPPGF